MAPKIPASKFRRQVVRLPDSCHGYGGAEMTEREIDAATGWPADELRRALIGSGACEVIIDASERCAELEREIGARQVELASLRRMEAGNPWRAPYTKPAVCDRDLVSPLLDFKPGALPTLVDVFAKASRKSLRRQIALARQNTK